MRRLRALLTASLCILLSALWAGAAYACNEPKIAVSPQGAHAGDRVAFTIVNTDAGARYTVSVADNQVASGEDADGGGVSGTFAMPDLGGSERAVFVSAVIGHEVSDDVHAASPWRSSREMRYLVAAGSPQTGTRVEQPGSGPPAQAAPAEQQASGADRRSTRSDRATAPASGRGSPPGQTGEAGGRSGPGKATSTPARGAFPGFHEDARVFPGSAPLAESSVAPKRDARKASGLSDLWSGFASPGGGRLASLAGPAASSGGAGPSMGIGLVMLGLGAIALAAGLLAAEAGRRRARTGAGRQPPG